MKYFKIKDLAKKINKQICRTAIGSFDVIIYFIWCRRQARTTKSIITLPQLLFSEKMTLKKNPRDSVTKINKQSLQIIITHLLGASTTCKTDLRIPLGMYFHRCNPISIE
jgi:hypothetical protein